MPDCESAPFAKGPDNGSSEISGDIASLISIGAFYSFTSILAIENIRVCPLGNSEITKVYIYFYYGNFVAKFVIFLYTHKI